MRKVDPLRSRKKPQLKVRNRFLGIYALLASEILMTPTRPEVQRVEERVRVGDFIEADSQ